MFQVYVLGLRFGFRFSVLGYVTETMHKSKCISLVTWPILPIGYA